jgi:hypothetical protein
LLKKTFDVLSSASSFLEFLFISLEMEKRRDKETTRGREEEGERGEAEERKNISILAHLFFLPPSLR